MSHLKIGESKVLESRESPDGTMIRRRRVSLDGKHRFTTYERIERPGMMVRKLRELYPDFDAKQYGSHLTHHRPLWRFELRNTFVLPHSWTAVLGVRFASDADDEFQSIKRYWTVGARINKSFFNKALLVNLYADDIFKTSQERWTTYGIGTNITKDCYNFDRTIGMTVTYKFNVTRSKYKGTGAGNDEKSRL